jgi:hypothetical protein
VIHGAPVITGLLPLGEAAAFTEPRVGRGTLLSFLQAVAVRDALREGADDDPAELVVRWDAQFQEQVAPTLRATNGVTRGPTKGMRAYISGDEPVLDRTNRGAVLNRAFENAARIDHDIARLLGELGASVALPHERLGPSTVERILDIGDHDELDLPPAGPSRGELLDLLAGR